MSSFILLIILNPWGRTGNLAFFSLLIIFFIKGNKYSQLFSSTSAMLEKCCLVINKVWPSLAGLISKIATALSFSSIIVALISFWIILQNRHSINYFYL